MGYDTPAGSGIAVDIPAHVPPALVADIDYFALSGAAEDPHLAWRALHDGPDIIFTPRNGGHWIATRADDMFSVMHDVETFSSREFTVPPRGPGNPVLIPNQIDPPDHGPLRSILLRPLGPKAVDPFEPVIRDVMRARISQLAPRGGCEFVADFGADIPAELFLRYADLPTDKLEIVKSYADTIARAPSEDDRREARLAAARYLDDVLAERRLHRGSDLFSTIVDAEAEGCISGDQSLSLALNVFIGGLETVSSALAFIVLFLARNPEHRRQLLDDPALSLDAAEELLRRFGILNLARIATHDTTLKGVRIAQGEQVLLPLHLAGLDDRRFPDPLEVDFHRKRSAHYNFGTGPHRCLGSNLARPEIRIFIEEWLRQIPDFMVDPHDEPVGRSGVAMTMTRVPLRWSIE
jgi:cytochrome P450